MDKINYNKRQSRKWDLVLLVFFTAVVAVLVPPLVSVWVFGKAPLVVLSGTEFVSLITLIVSTYFGANVLQKNITHVATDTKVVSDNKVISKTTPSKIITKVDDAPAKSTAKVEITEEESDDDGKEA
jgi:hypothetical protein